MKHEIEKILNNGVEVTLNPGSVSFNIEELTRIAEETALHYKSLVFGDEQVTEAKKERADLNKIVKSLKDVKASKKKEFLKPLDSFLKECDAVIQLFDNTSNIVDEQVKNFLEAEWKTKKIDILEIEKELRTTFEDIRVVVEMQENWKNKTCKISTVKKEMQESIKKQLETFKLQDDKIKMQNEKKKVLDDLIETYSTMNNLKYPIKYTEVEQYLDYDFSDINDIIKEMATTRKQNEIEFDKPEEVVKKVVTEVAKKTTKEVVEVKKERILKLNLTKSQANLLVSFLKENNIEFEGV